jgi:hypothetical protein
MLCYTCGVANDSCLDLPLQVDTVISLVTLLLCEGRVLFNSHSLSKLTLVMQSLLQVCRRFLLMMLPSVCGQCYAVSSRSTCGHC